MKKITRREFIKTSLYAGIGLTVGCQMINKFDIIIKNGMIIDGTGIDGFEADIGISGEKITAIGKLSSKKARKIIDASGKIISPGFIDIHSHTDTELFVNPYAEGKLRQGITTEISGNCGISPFPLRGKNIAKFHNKLHKRYDIKTNWKDIEDFFLSLEHNGTAVNYASLIGHGDLRATVVGRNDVKPTTKQMKKMKEIIAEYMKTGALGLSTGLEYAPGSYATTKELIELSKVVSKYNGIYATHMRNEDDTVIEAIEEAIEICKKAEVSLEISHLKACNKKNWHKVDIFLDLIQKEINKGFPILADRYPYNAYSTGLSAFIPIWARQGSDDEMISRLKDKKTFKKIAEYINGRFINIGGSDRVIISYCSEAENKKYEGKSIKENAILANKNPIDFTRELLINDTMNTEIVGFAMDENNLKKILSTSFINLCTDASARAPYGKLSAGKPHPRGFGSFPRMLGKYVRQEKIINMPNAIRKMTSQPAKKMQLKRRGELKENLYADIVIFDPKTVIDNATYTRPRKYPTGIDYVIVNGKIALENGNRANKTFGKILRHKS